SHQKGYPRASRQFRAGAVNARGGDVKPPVLYGGNIEEHPAGGCHVVWARNLLFLGVIGGGVVALGANLLPPRKPAQISHYDAREYQDPKFRETVDQVDLAFRQQWLSDGINPTAPAPDLIQARRLSLGLMGTVPSLEEIRQFETLLPNERMPWWIDHVL